MANISAFTAQNGGFTGTLLTLILNVKVKLAPNEKGSENAPDSRLQVVGGAEIGAAWKKTSQESGFGTPLMGRLTRRSDPLSLAEAPSPRGGDPSCAQLRARGPLATPPPLAR
jgi:hypothetical protein